MQMLLHFYTELSLSPRLFLFCLVTVAAAGSGESNMNIE